VNNDLVEDFLGRVVADGAAAVAGLSTALGVRLGLFRAMVGAGSLTSEQLAERTGLNERYVREWLAAQVAGEYVGYDPEDDTYLLPDEHAAVLADPDSPTYAMGPFLGLGAFYAAEDALTEAFRTGGGVSWHENGWAKFESTAEGFRPSYAASLVPEWLPALGGSVVEALERGASVADVGCGFGHSTLLMARAFPRSHFHGYDFHCPSITKARRLAAEQGLDDRVSFDVATAQDFPGGPYDLITFFDCLHDMGDPGGAMQRAEQALADDGTCMVVEPNASANPLENVSPSRRAFAAASVVGCLPTALSQEGSYALGNHAGEDVMRAIAEQAGFRDWKLAAEGTTNRVYAARR
jgi:2-polyprenyl-3-methyl-5-hydroxy-6-metoxy-1,4-benzoquinol methylase